MTRRSNRRSPWFALLLSLVLPVAAAAASHEAKPAKAWDAEEVGTLLGKLAQETSKMKDALGRYLKEAEADSPRRIVLEDVHEIHHRTISLQTGVRAGLGRDETEPVFRRLLDGVRNARRDAQSFEELESMSGHIDAANAILDELEGYYGLHE